MINKNTQIININNKSFKISLDYIMGLFEGDGSLTIQLKPNLSHKTGKQVILIFEIHQHVIDIDLLKAISLYLGAGKVEVGKKSGNPESWVYRLRISNQKEILNILLPILQTQTMMLNKREFDKNLFINACTIVKERKHINIEGQSILLNITSQLSSKLNLENKINLFNFEREMNYNPERITGFVDAEGNFYFTIVHSKTNSNYTGINFSFNITQEKSEIHFLNNLVKFFGCGNVFTNSKGGGSFVVSNKKDLIDKIIPFFEVNELQTIKRFSFLRFKKALNISIKNKPLSNNNIEEIKMLLEETTGKRP
jgi:hypothetical protein